MNLLPSSSISNRLPLVTGMLVATLGLLAIFGWHTHNIGFISLYEAWTPMHYNAALGLFLCGIGLLGASLSSWRISFGCSVVVILLAAVTLAEYAFHANFRIDELLMPYYLGEAGEFPGRMQPNAAGTLFLSGLTLVSIGYGLFRRVEGYTFANLLGMLVALFGLLSLFGYFSAIDSGQAWTRITVMPPHEAIGFTLLGFAVAVFRWPEDAQENVDARRLQGVVITYVSAGVLVTMLFSAAIGLLPLYELLRMVADSSAGQPGTQESAQVMLSIHDRIESSLQRQFALTGIATLLLAYLGGFGVWLLLRPLTGRILMRADALEKMIRKATAELEISVRNLERSNRELDQYAHIASHDLQAPLHGIAGFAQMIDKQYGALLGAEGRKYITYISSGAHEMQEMVQGMLELSRLNSDVQPLKPVDVCEVLRQARAHVQSSIDTSHAHVECLPRPLPIVSGNQTQLVQLFQNLVANGIKFARPGVAPEVRITVERQGPGWLFGVHDNGIGIEPAYREKIFEMFHRLHAQSDYPGSGIGLALCKKIVERHGGKIWVDSNPAGGSSFMFTLLPDEENKPSASPDVKEGDLMEPALADSGMRETENE